MKNFVRLWIIAPLIFMNAPIVFADPFQQDIAPLLTKYCITCHSTKKKTGDLDLERFTSMDIVNRDPAVWEHALDRLHDNEMPPKDKPRPSPEQVKLLTNWMQHTLDQIGLASAGDPGPVVLRRLSNMEDTYTIRDLTGVESLDPAKEFPIDGAAGEGFTNVGAALVMSSSLLTKYFDAAKDITNHAALLPDGIRFSPGTSSRDWTDETMARIREFYARFSEHGGATAVNLQGIKFETNAGGRLAIAKYVSALLAERDAFRAGKSIAEVASSRGLNAKYLTTLWRALNDTKPSLVLDAVRERFRSASPSDAAGLTKLIQDWQQSLWRFTSVGLIGRLNGPKSWQEPVTPLAMQQELRVKLIAPKDGGNVKLYLATTDATADGKAKGSVVWDNARLVTKGAKDVFAALRDLAVSLA